MAVGHHTFPVAVLCFIVFAFEKSRGLKEQVFYFIIDKELHHDVPLTFSTAFSVWTVRNYLNISEVCISFKKVYTLNSTGTAVLSGKILSFLKTNTHLALTLKYFSSPASPFSPARETSHVSSTYKCVGIWVFTKCQVSKMDQRNLVVIEAVKGRAFPVTTLRGIFHLWSN